MKKRHVDMDKREQKKTIRWLSVQSISFSIECILHKTSTESHSQVYLSVAQCERLAHNTNNNNNA